jgi:hypothetical protein
MNGKVTKLLQQWKTTSVWRVTGTPFSTSLDQLCEQAMMLGQYYDGLKLKEVRRSAPPLYLDSTGVPLAALPCLSTLLIPLVLIVILSTDLGPRLQVLVEER